YAAADTTETYTLSLHDALPISKALDNRVGCYMAIQVLKELAKADHPNTVIAGATVQEEVGLRGAVTSPHAVEPDIAFVLDVGVRSEEHTSELQSRENLVCRLLL